MPCCDVLVVGGGPAGSSCAWRLVAAGRNVVILDAARFPRDKVCAGWITPQTLDSLRLDAREYAQGLTFQPFTGFRVEVIGRRAVTVTYPTAVSYGIRRCEFDDYLLRRSGARVVEGEPVRVISRAGPIWKVNGWQARTLVGAGGHFCPVARTLAPDRRPRSLVVAQEAECRVEGASADGALRAETPELYFCEDLAGYAWCVRKGHYLNVGIGHLDPRSLPSRLAAFVQRLVESGRIAAAVPVKGHAYWLYPDSPRPLGGDAVLLVGDSAGLAYEASGEGIRPAIESGILAAEAILECETDPLATYAQRIQKRFGRRGPRAPGPAFLPARARAAAARSLMGRAWFARRVLDGGFLHRATPPLHPTATH